LNILKKNTKRKFFKFKKLFQNKEIEQVCSFVFLKKFKKIFDTVLFTKAEVKHASQPASFAGRQFLACLSAFF
jgi:hypothetical protein